MSKTYTMEHSQAWDAAVLAGSQARLEKLRRSRLVRREPK